MSSPASTAEAASRGAPPIYSDSSGRYYIVQPNERFHNRRYEALQRIGKGVFSYVWLAKDLQQQSYVVLKFLTRDRYSGKHDIFEVEILQRVVREQTQLGDEIATNVIKLLDVFDLSGPNGTHRCIVMPVLGCTIKTQAERFPDRRIPVSIMKEIVRQLLTGLAFLHNQCGVIDTDLQPNNILFEIGEGEIERMARGEFASAVTPTITPEEPGRIQIIDLGVASWIDKHLSDRIQPVHLRAPEVILGAPWGPPVDIWSLGCLVIEFVMGHLAFPAEGSKECGWTSEDAHLAQHMEILGPMPPELLKRGRWTHKYFDSQGNLIRIPELHFTSLTETTDGSEAPMHRPREMGDEDLAWFVDFLRGALMLDPERRKTADELLRHEWLKQVHWWTE
ncbi:hypothetical protein LTR56_014300 [Elasticomyces elasticus]|nr:hypothetical protein LTR22_023549 [Elasticomyces elasticus]KAK3636344.1 hypothetical protein LTR56_014300 [Elasticomyces elasticus]KAK5750469.1 hypothetical protein LTS12_019499 [Elasticomyces elasticus]